MLIGILVLFGIIFIIAKATQGNKSETIRKIDQEGNEVVEIHTATEPSAGTRAARGTLAVVGSVIGFIVFIFIGLLIASKF